MGVSFAYTAIHGLDEDTLLPYLLGTPSPTRKVLFQGLVGDMKGFGDFLEACPVIQHGFDLSQPFR